MATHLRITNTLYFFPGDFDSELVNSIIPYIEENFKVKKGRNNRAVAGLSLGSAQATDIAARHPELFFSSWGYFQVLQYIS